MNLLEQMLKMAAQRNGKATPGERLDERPRQTSRSFKHVWVIEISRPTSKAREKGSQVSNAATIYEFGKPFEASSIFWELIDRQQHESRGEADQFWQGLLSKMSRLGMKQGDLILVTAEEQERIDCAVREISFSTMPFGEIIPAARQIARAAGAHAPQAEVSGNHQHDAHVEHGEVEQVLAAVRRVKLIEYLKKNLA